MTPAELLSGSLPNVLVGFAAAVLSGVCVPALGMYVLVRALRRAAAVA